MILEEKLRRREASKGKIYISKQLDEEGKPTVISKILYLAEGASENDFEEVDESKYENIEK